MPEHFSTAEVRSALAHNSTVSDDLALRLEQQLPATWRKLIYRHGRARVFNCLRLNMTIGGAQYELDSRPHLRRIERKAIDYSGVVMSSRWLR